MKYITLIIGLLVMGCGKQEQTDTNESTPTTTEKPDKKLTKEGVVGTYEHKTKVGNTYREVYLDNGNVELYNNGKKLEGDYQWSISKDGELHVVTGNGRTDVMRINKDGSTTYIATIRDGKRKEAPKEDILTFKKIK